MNRPAFTLIEQLAAVALSSLFVLAGLAVITRLGQVGAAQATGHDEANTLRRAADLIEWDLTQSERYRARDNGVILSGFGSLDATMNATHRPVRVEYGVDSSGDTGRLFRRQTSLDALSNNATQRDAVADGISRVELLPLQTPRATTRPVAGLFGPGDGPMIADVMKLVIVPADGRVAPYARFCRLK